RKHQPLQISAREPAHIAAQLRPHLLDIKSGRGEIVRRIDLVRRRQPHLRQRDLELPLVLRDLPLHLDVAALGAVRRSIGDVIPHSRVKGPSLIRQNQRQELPPLFLLPHLHSRQRKVGGHIGVLKLRRISNIKVFHRNQNTLIPNGKRESRSPRARMNLFPILLVCRRRGSRSSWSRRSPAIRLRIPVRRRLRRSRSRLLRFLLDPLLRSALHLRLLFLLPRVTLHSQRSRLGLLRRLRP